MKDFFIMNNVYKGFHSLTVTYVLIPMFQLHTTGLHQAIVSIYWVGLLEPPWLLVIGVLRTNKLVLFLAS